MNIEGIQLTKGKSNQHIIEVSNSVKEFNSFAQSYSTFSLDMCVLPGHCLTPALLANAHVNTTNDLIT